MSTKKAPFFKKDAKIENPPLHGRFLKKKGRKMKKKHANTIALIILAVELGGYPRSTIRIIHHL